ncbi:hypothetical protein D3C77_501440 [compost metagenome]
MPLPQLRVPGQEFDALSPHQVDQGERAGLLIKAWQRRCGQHQLPHLQLPLSLEQTFPFIPVDLIDRPNKVGQLLIEQGRIEITRQVNPLLTLALPATQIGYHQPLVLGESIRL